MRGPRDTEGPASRDASGRSARPGARRALAVAGALLALAAPAGAAADDRVATAWQEQAGTAPLLHAPAPANPATICFIDTGVTPTPDLDIVARTSLLGDPLDDVRATATHPGHGTAVAHFAAGRVNGWGGAGAFPHAKVASVRIFPSAAGAHWDDYISGLNYCKNSAPTKVIVMSLGGQQIQPGEAAELENRIINLRDVSGINVVVAAGNGGGETDFPGRFPASLTVAALDGAGGLCSFSSRGTNVDLAAPGCGLEQAGWNGSMWLMDGTSFSAPIVAGVLVALRSYRPDLGPKAAEQILLDTARPGPFPTLDASAALRAIGRGDIVDHYRPTVPGPSPSGEPQAVPTRSPTLPHTSAAQRVVTTSGSTAAIAKSPGVKATRPFGLVKPKLRAGRVSRGRVTLRATNRPKGALLELRIGTRLVHSRSSQMTARVGRVRTVRARYVTDLLASRWVQMSIKPH